MKTIDEMKAELEQLKAKATDAAPALSAEDEERAKLRNEINRAKASAARKAAEVREAAEDKAFEELEVTLAGVALHRIDTTAGMIVLRPPSIAKSRVFQQVALKGKLSPDALDEFVRPCVVYPDPDAFEAMLDKAPLLAATLCQFAQEIASEEAARRGKK